MSDKEAIDLSDFIIFMKLRNPYWLSDTLEPNKVKWIESAIVDAYEGSFEHPIFKKIPKDLKEFLVRDIINKNINDLNFSKKLQLYSLIQRDETPDQNRKFRESVINCEWILLESPRYGPYFITSDNPGFSLVSNNLIYNTRFQNGFRFYFPLSFKNCLLFSDRLKDFSFSKRNEKSISMIKVDGNTIIQINDKTIQRINKLLIGGDDWYLNYIIKNNSPK